MFLVVVFSVFWVLLNESLFSAGGEALDRDQFATSGFGRLGRAPACAFPVWVTTFQGKRRPGPRPAPGRERKITQKPGVLLVSILNSSKQGFPPKNHTPPQWLDSHANMLGNATCSCQVFVKPPTRGFPVSLPSGSTLMKQMVDPIWMSKILG